MRYLQIKACERKKTMNVDLLDVFLGGWALGLLAGVYIWG